MTVILSIVSSILYRIGGCGKEEIPFANSQYRDIGCPVIVLIVLLLNGVNILISLVCATFFLLFIRTYWDFMTGDDSMFMHGIGLGLSFVPLAFIGSSPWNVSLYTACLAVSMELVNQLCNRFNVKYSVWIEELFRGFVIIFSMKLLFM